MNREKPGEYLAAKRSIQRALRQSLALLALTGSIVLQTQAGFGQAIKGNTPPFVAKSMALNREDGAKRITISLWLNPHNHEEMDKLAAELYDPKSPNFRHWLNNDEVAAKFAPTAAEAKIVGRFLESHNLKVVAIGPHNFYVRAEGTVSDVETALHVTLFNYQVNGQIIRANSTDPVIEGEAGALVRHVGGIDGGQYKHPLRTATPLNGAGKSGLPAAGVTADTIPHNFFVSNCFPGTKTESWDTLGGYPKASYSGNYYHSTGPGCGYTPPEIHEAFNLTSLYKRGLDGNGQTIVIVDWCGSPTIQSDANAFSALFGLPKLTSSNFQIIETPTPSQCAGPDPEINIDVEWAHAVAPGANIALVVPPSAYFQDTDQAVFYAINYSVGSVISGSYGAPEAFVAPTELLTQDLISEIGAIRGIATNFSSGDVGDFSVATGGVVTVSAPADSPWATAVGGTTVALEANNKISWQTGWGNSATPLRVTGSIILDPSQAVSYFGGSGGGASGFFAKPEFQNSLPGPARLLPDISWLADPYTGGVIAISYPGQFPALTYFTIGGTSLSCPMFSALWAIANQRAGVALGQAAPYLYSMPPNTITDILPKNSGTNVRGTTYASAAPADRTFYSAPELAGVAPDTRFYSALWDDPGGSDTNYVLIFGPNSSLTTTVGWDDTTGLGTPNPAGFVDWFRPAPAPAATK